MSNDLSTSNNQFLKSLGSTIMNDEWLAKLYKTDIDNQKNELKVTFGTMDVNSVNAAQKKALQNKAESIKDKISRLEAEMAVLADSMKKLQDEIDKRTNAVADLAGKVQDKTSTLQRKQRNNIKTVIDDVFHEYSRGIIKRDQIPSEINARVRRFGNNIALQAELDDLLSQLGDKQSDISKLVDQAADLVDQKKLFESQFAVSKATYEMLIKNIAKIGNTDTSYTNSDFDDKAPIYSVAKLGIISDLYENSKINVEADNTEYKAGSQPPTMDSINEKYSKYFSKTETKGVDANSIDNKAVKKLGKAVEKGLLQDLAQVGMKSDDIAKYLVDNFAGTKMEIVNGEFVIPYGHGKKAKAIYKDISKFFKQYDGSYGGANTWDKKAGNTISSNSQLKALANNYENIFKVMSQDPKFTFKEAMYALFNSDNGLFKDCGINFDLKKSAKDGGPRYSFNKPGDAKTAKLYKNIAAKISDIWGVDVDSTKGTKVSRKKAETQRKDPLSFTQGNTEFTFVVDRNNDGVFSGQNEFLGAKAGTTWVDDLKSLDKDANGVLDKDELKSLKILSSDYKDNAKVKKNKKGYLRSEQTNINYAMTDAQTMGIQQIDLNNLDKNLNNSKNIVDANGSMLYNDSFSFEMNGQNVTATRKDDTKNYMDAVYSAAYGKGFEMGLDDATSDSIINNAYTEAENLFKNKGIDTDKLLNDAKNMQDDINGSVSATQSAYSNTNDVLKDDEMILLARSSNKAMSLNPNYEWNNSMYYSVLEYAADNNIIVNDDLIEQTKGLFILNPGFDAQQLVQKYIQQYTRYQLAINRETYANETWNALFLCNQQGINTDANEVLQILVSGKAKNAQGVVDVLKQKAQQQNPEN